jgi:hypothetical protein
MRLLPTIAALINAVVILAEPCRAQMPGNFASVPQRELVIKHLQGAVHGMNDLSDVHVGAVAGTSTEETLSRLRVYRGDAFPLKNRLSKICHAAGWSEGAARALTRRIYL